MQLKFSPSAHFPNTLLLSLQLEFSPSAHFSNVEKMLRFHASTLHASLGQEVDRRKWSTSPATVNAYYSRTNNMISELFSPPYKTLAP